MITAVLKNYPFVGALLAVLPSVWSFIEGAAAASESVFRWIGIVVGVLIGIWTLWIKIEERRIKQLERMELEGEIEVAGDNDNKKFRAQVKEKDDDAE